MHPLIPTVFHIILCIKNVIIISICNKIICLWLYLGVFSRCWVFIPNLGHLRSSFRVLHLGLTTPSFNWLFRYAYVKVNSLYTDNRVLDEDSFLSEGPQPCAFTMAKINFDFLLFQMPLNILSPICLMVAPQYAVRVVQLEWNFFKAFPEEWIILGHKCLKIRSWHNIWTCTSVNFAIYLYLRS